MGFYYNLYMDKKINKINEYIDRILETQITRGQADWYNDLEEFEKEIYHKDLTNSKKLISENLTFEEVQTLIDDDFYLDKDEINNLLINYLTKKTNDPQIDIELRAKMLEIRVIELLEYLVNTYSKLDGVDMDFDHWKDTKNNKIFNGLNIVRLSVKSGESNNGELLVTLKEDKEANVSLVKVNERFDFCVSYKNKNNIWTFEVKYATLTTWKQFIRVI